MMSVVLPAPVSPMSSMCCASACSGIRIISLASVVLKPMPSPLTVLLNSLGVSITGPLSRRPYFIPCGGECLSDGKRELREQREEAEQERKLVDVPELFASVDGILEVRVETAINVFCSGPR
jgi:hypothetical protein